MSTNSDRRRSFRISESALLNYRILDEETFAAGIAHWRIQSGDNANIRSQLTDIDARIQEVMFRAASESPAICELARLLNDKINLVAEALPDCRDAIGSLAERRPQIVEISSEGMFFGVDREIPRGAKLLLQCMLLTENRYVETFAQVVRSKERGDADEHRYRVAVRFNGMSPAEREKLIQYLFQRQSESLRLRRQENA